MHAIASLAVEDVGATLTAADTKAFLASLLPAPEAIRFERLVEGCGVRKRQAVGSFDSLRGLRTLEERNALYMSHAPAAAERTGRTALGRAGLRPDQVDVLIVASSTGFAVPTLDQHLVARLGLRPDVRSIYLPGLGCAGAVRGIGLARDLIGSVPAQHALVIGVELCSPWLQVLEPSPEDMLSNILFGDGAGAVVVSARAKSAALEIVAWHSQLWPESLSARGAILTQSGFRHFATPTLPRIARRHLAQTVDAFLARHRVGRRELRFFAANPSDHRVLESIGRVLEIPDALMRPAWDAWESHGNTLSAGPLYVLDALRSDSPPAMGDLGLAVVLGPGLTCDLMLLRSHGVLPS